MAHFAGLVAAGVHPSPVPFAEFITSTTHKTLRGPRGGIILARESESKAIASSIFPGSQGGPLMHVIAGKAVAFLEAQGEEFKAYQRQVVANARALADGLTRRGFRIVSGGTDNHLLLLDLRATEITGRAAQESLDLARITANKNTVPFETRSPFVTSGLRMGTPTVTTRGMREPEMDMVADLVSRALSRIGDATALSAIGEEVTALCRNFPLYAA